jgi:ligand-binding sensor domain-containing protein
MKIGRLACWTFAFAAVLVSHWPEAWAQRWTSHLSASWIREIVHRDERLYLATGGGLVVFDTASEEFTQYTNVSGLPSNNLTCLDFLPDGSLYVGTQDIGLAVVTISGGQLRVVRQFSQLIDGLADNTVNSVAAWGDDVVYGTDGGAGTIVDDSPQDPLREVEGMPSNVVNDVLPIGPAVVMATDSGVVVLDEFDILTIPDGGPGQANVIGSDGTLIYVGTDDGVWTLDPTDSTWSDIGPDSRTIYSLHYDGLVVRAGARENVWEYQGSAVWDPVSLAEAYGKYRIVGSTAEVRGLAVSGNGDVYVGTGQSVLARGFNLARWDGSTLVDLAPNTPGANDVQRLAADIDGSVWGAFRGFYVGKLDPRGRWLNYNSTIPESDSLSNRFVNTTCLADLDGFKWFCTLSVVSDPDPMDRLDDKLDADYGNDEWTRLSIGSGGGDGLGSLRLQKAVLDPVGNRWFLSDDSEGAAGWEGMHILNRNQSAWLQVKTNTPDAALAAGNVVDVAFTDLYAYVALKDWGVQRWRHGGYEWAALSNLSGDAWSEFWRMPPSVTNVSSVAVTPDGKVWIGTTNGVYRIDDRLPPSDRERRFGQFNTFSAGLLGVRVNDLLVDHDGDLWIATSAGLNRISRDDENDIDAWSTAAEYQRSLIQLQFPFDVISPLVNELCQSLAIHPEEPILYVGTDAGLSVFDYPEPPPTPQPLDQAYLFPNPVYERMGHSELFIENVSGPVVVEVYNVEGELVHSTPSGEVRVAGERVWDLTDQGGFLVASGVYFVRIVSTAGGGAVVKPVSLIR